METRKEQQVRIVKIDRDAAGHCRSCGSRVTWATTLDGRAMPMQPGRSVALCTPELRKRHVVFMARYQGSTKTVRVRDMKHAARLQGLGWILREEIVELWEVPASLTHWPHCPAAHRHRTT